MIRIVSNDVIIISALASDITVLEPVSYLFSKWVFRIVHVKNYETLSKFVKVMLRKP